jgi:hypothetical protein
MGTVVENLSAVLANALPGAEPDISRPEISPKNVIAVRTLVDSPA